MMASKSQYNLLWWDDVEEGAILPGFVYELSMVRLVSFVRATGLYDFVHFDTDYARSLGLQDAFISTPHNAGLLGRLIGTWSGPGARLHSLTFLMNTQSFRGDMLSVTGKVGRKYRGDDGACLVELVKLNIANNRTPSAVSGTAIVELPSRDRFMASGGRRPVAAAEQTLNPGMPDFARRVLGTNKLGIYEPALPLTEEAILLWCESLEDWNPLYWDKDAAAAQWPGRIISPPMGMFYGAAASVSAGIGYLRPGVTVPEPIAAGLTGTPLLKKLRQMLIDDCSVLVLPDYPEAAIVKAHFEFFKPLYPGDSARNEQSLINCSSVKKTSIGEGYFCVFENRLIDQDGEMIKRLTTDLFYYRVN